MLARQIVQSFPTYGVPFDTQMFHNRATLQPT
jgi:hypothetical protein